MPIDLKENENKEQQEHQKVEKTIEEVLQDKKKHRKKTIILIIIIIILLVMFWLLGYKMGKIGYEYKEVYNPNVNTIDNNYSDNINIIKVTKDNIDILKNENLDIFVNEKFGGEKKIAPHSKGTYQFCIENVTDDDITYNIKFSDEMNYLINMKYKLKIDNVYIRGNQDTYVDLDILKVEDVIVLKDSINIFTLEWYWEDDDVQDTLVGSQETDEYYKLIMEIEASQYNKQLD